MIPPFRYLFFCAVATLSAYPPAIGQDLERIRDVDPFTISGGLSFDNSFYGVTNVPNRRSPYSYIINGNTLVRFYGVSIPLSFIYTDEQSRFSQPFRQFGLSPRYKWATMHLGHRSMTFSPFTLAGHTFLGGGVELNPGLFRFGAMYGRLNKAIPEDTTQVPQSRLYRTPLPSYQRTGYAVKIGVGSDRNFFDLIFMKARDDSTSIPFSPELFDVSPGENTMVGVSGRVHFFKRFVWQTDAAVSVYTIDSRAERIDLTDIPAQGLVRDLFDPRTSTQYLSALESHLSYRQTNFTIQLKYRRVDPDYKSMGAYYFLTDIEQYTIAPSFNLFKNRVFLAGSLGLQRDNLNDKKLATTHRTISSLNLNYNPSPVIGLNFQYSNYGMSQRSGLRQLTDTTRVQQVTQSFGFAPYVNIHQEKSSHNISLYVGYQTLDDDNRFTSEFTEMNSFHTRLNYNLRFTDTQWTINPSLMYIKSAFSLNDTQTLGLGLGTGKPFMENSVVTNLRMGYNKNYFNGDSNGFTFTTAATVDYRPFRNTNHSLRGSIRLIRNQVEDTTLTESFSEFTGNMGYHYSF